MFAETSLFAIIIAGLALGGIAAALYIFWGRIFLQAGGVPSTTPPIGRMPTMREEEELQGGWPKLKGFTITDGPTGDYNCIGYALCSRAWGWVQPSSGLGAKAQMAWLDRIFLAKGWIRSKDCKPKKGLRKLAVYCDATGALTHVAKQLIDDWWESKLGPADRVVHRGPGQLEGQLYGKVCRCYEKSLQSLIKDAQRLAKTIKPLVMGNKHLQQAYQDLQNDIKRWQDALMSEVGTMK